MGRRSSPRVAADTRSRVRRHMQSGVTHCTCTYVSHRRRVLMALRNVYCIQWIDVASVQSHPWIDV